MPPKRATGVVAAPRPSEAYEFRAREDDAWYGVRLRAEHRGGPGVPPEHFLRVMYSNFAEVWDETFRAGSFSDEAALEEFSRRFRPPSVQLQDRQCRVVIEGMTVCASHVFGDADVRFYDAIVEEVCFSDHKIIEGEQLCTCTFVLLWQHGPNAGRKTTTGIEHVCLLQQRGTEIDPVLGFFLDMSRKNIKSSKQNNVSVGCGETHHATAKNEPNRSDSKFLGTRSSQKLDKTKETFSGRSSIPSPRIGQDIDLGGHFPKKSIHSNACFYFILIENLEKDLLPQAIVDFIYRRTSIFSQAHVSPSLMSESYTRGAIFLETEEKADRLLSFLRNPKQIVVSSRGRPWVIAGRKLKCGSAGLILKSEGQLPNKPEEYYEIKVVHAGTKEFAKAKSLQELFTEFHDHIQCLHRRLASEEMKLLQSFHAT
uniref:SAWADEE domain-containing protein n=1 Tax=Anthurium amnicola TaxID=1678845 RepID=A0A1D1YG09_9ARAE